MDFLAFLFAANPCAERLPGRAQVELFCISKLINCLLDSDEEFVYMDCHFATGTSPQPLHSPLPSYSHGHLDAG